MRKTWTLHAAPLACAAMLIACGGTDGANDDRPANAGQQPPAQQTASYAPVQLSGCIEADAGKAEYRLRNVRFEPRQGDAHASLTTPANHGITDGSWVRLQGDVDVKQYAGQRVKVTGKIVDDGANRRGTAGTAGTPAPSGDRSQAAETDKHHSEKQKLEMGRIARESLANGTAAEIRVQQVEPTGDKCDPVRPARP
jgi:hypothetical protein